MPRNTPLQATSIPHPPSARSLTHTLSTSCWCQPITDWDGHRNDDGSDVDFEGMAGDPIDADGYPLEATP